MAPKRKRKLESPLTISMPTFDADAKRHDMHTKCDELLTEIREALLPPLQKIIVTYVMGHRWATDGPMHSPFIDIDIDGEAATPKPNFWRDYFGVFGQDVLAIAGPKWKFRSKNMSSQYLYLGFALWDEHIFSSGLHDTKCNDMGGVRILKGQIDVYGGGILTPMLNTPIVIPLNDDDEVELTFQLVPCLVSGSAAHQVWLDTLGTRVCLGNTTSPLTCLVPYACFPCFPLLAESAPFPTLHIC